MGIEKHKLMKHVEVDRETGCWNWTGYKSDQGYGRVFREGTAMGAHRAMWKATYPGTLKPRVHLDHTCNNRACINPDHLEIVTQKENNKRRADRATHCKNGHPITEDSHYTFGDRRRCKQCQRDVMNRATYKKAMAERENEIEDLISRFPKVEEQDIRALYEELRPVPEYLGGYEES